jgi:hypothetical protein
LLLQFYKHIKLLTVEFRSDRAACPKAAKSTSAK